MTLLMRHLFDSLIDDLGKRIVFDPGFVGAVVACVKAPEKP
ncbi:MAG TPA: hypothetical protein PLO62_08570 [Candidatus Hydrogenedentes bacterium]|nr:hypothetical protein [Candidatus Hydrogenedentota bacterium]HOS02394.1 hypothetical protein [Candidatus Hydrogenedentota bacterium]